MKRFNFLAGLVAAGGLVLAVAVAPVTARAAGRRLGNGPFYGAPLDGFGNGTATDDKTGVGCQDPNNPNLNCPVGDYCSCITGTGAFKGIAALPGTVTTEISVDFSNDFNLYGTPNGSGGYCFGASGVGTAADQAGNTISFNLQGSLCDLVPTGTAPDLIYGSAFTGSYSITGGTGRFTGQAGTGSFTETDSDVNTADAPTTFTAVGSSGH